MKTEEFVAQVRRSVVEENTEIYRDMFENTTDATDPYAIRAIAFYKGLDDQQKEVLFEIVRQVTVDAVSTIFGLIDGVMDLDGQDGSIRLQCGPDELSGELSDRFLEQFED